MSSEPTEPVDPADSAFKAALGWRWWWIALTIAALALPLILVCGPAYGTVQRATTRGSIALLVDDKGRYLAAGLVDVVFAAAYGLAGLAIVRRVGLHWAVAMLWVLGAALDEVENVLVLLNVRAFSNLKAPDPNPEADNWRVELMHDVGTWKGRVLLAGIGVLVLTAIVVVIARRKEIMNMSDKHKRAVALVIWFATLMAFLAGFAGTVRAEAPILAIVGTGLACVAVFARLSAADRRVTSDVDDVRAVLAFIILALGCLSVTAASVVADVSDLLGFAGLGGFVYGVVRSIEHARHCFSERPSVSRSREGIAAAAVAAFAVACLVDVELVRLIGGAVTVGLGAIAVEMCSARFPKDLSDHRYLAGGFGLVLVAVVSTGLYAKTNDPAVTFVVVATVGVVTGLLTSSRDVPVLLGVLLIAVLWSGVPREATLPLGQLPKDREPYFAVLGDSYISGEGTDEYFAGTNTMSNDKQSRAKRVQEAEEANECRRSPHAWPMLLNAPQTYDAGDIIGVPTRVYNRACSGGVTPDIRENGSDRRDEPEQLPALRATIKLHGAPKFVLVSVGGNDAGFADIGSACALPGDCTDYLERITDERLPQVGDEVARTLAEVRVEVTESVPVIAVPYPTPLHVGDGCRGVLLSRRDVAAINAFAKALDAKVLEAATRVGARYMTTMADALADSAAQLCEPNGPSGLNFADFNPKGGSLWAAANPKNWMHNFVHPNEGGHQVLRAAALRWFAGERCVLDGSCPASTITKETTALALENKPLPAELPHDTGEPLAAVVPIAVLVLGVLTLGWWLLITAWLAFTRERSEGRPSVLERGVTALQNGA